MKRGIAIAVIAALAACISFSLQAGSKDDAKSMVQKAIAFYKANGKDKAFAAISDKKGQFVNGDLYVFVYDMNGVCVAHGFNNKQIGKNLLDAKDPDGKFYVKERIALAKSAGSGWQDYKFTNPTTFKVEQKTAYIEKADSFIFGCGVYK